VETQSLTGQQSTLQSGSKFPKLKNPVPIIKGLWEKVRPPPNAGVQALDQPTTKNSPIETENSSNVPSSPQKQVVTSSQMIMEQSNPKLGTTNSPKTEQKIGSADIPPPLPTWLPRQREDNSGVQSRQREDNSVVQDSFFRRAASKIQNLPTTFDQMKTRLQSKTDPTQLAPTETQPHESQSQSQSYSEDSNSLETPLPSSSQPQEQEQGVKPLTAENGAKPSFLEMSKKGLSHVTKKTGEQLGTLGQSISRRWNNRGGIARDPATKKDGKEMSGVVNENNITDK